MDFEAELAAIFAGIDALEATAKAFQELWQRCKTDLGSKDLTDVQTLLKTSAAAIASLAHGDPNFATKLKADVATGLHKVGHLFGVLDRKLADVVDPAQAPPSLTPAAQAGSANQASAAAQPAGAQATK